MPETLIESSGNTTGPSSMLDWRREGNPCILCLIGSWVSTERRPLVSQPHDRDGTSEAPNHKSMFTSHSFAIIFWSNLAPCSSVTAMPVDQHSRKASLLDVKHSHLIIDGSHSHTKIRLIVIYLFIFIPQSNSFYALG